MMTFLCSWLGHADTSRALPFALLPRQRVRALLMAARGCFHARPLRPQAQQIRRMKAP